MNAVRIALCCLLCLLAAGCAAPKSTVLLLPDPDGHVGSITVTNTLGSQTVTQAGTATRVASAKAAPEAPAPVSAEEQEKLFGQALRALPSKPVRFLLYFESDGVQLTPEAQALLPKVLATAKERSSRDLSVVGHASKLGNEDFNINLSRKRAEFVSGLLVKGGIQREHLDITSHGSSNPLVVSSNPNEPKNRRVEVTVR